MICRAQGGRPVAHAPCQRGHQSSDRTGSTVRQDRTQGAWSHARERERSRGDTDAGWPTTRLWAVLPPFPFLLLSNDLLTK